MRCVAMFALLCACNSTAVGSLENAHAVKTAVEPYALGVEAAGTAVAPLSYQAPAPSCPQIYRIRIAYEPELKQEEASTSWLALGHSANDKVVQPQPGRPIPAGEIFEGRLHYEGIRVDDPGVSRDAFMSALHAGPTSPTAGCLGQTWDPIEDAFTLGWPKLTGRLTAVDEPWKGLRVEGKCNKSACVDPETGRGGADNPKRTCVTDNLRNKLSGLFTIGGEQFAYVTSTWTDGHGTPDAGNTTGNWSERRALLSIDHGRPTWARVVVHYNFPQQLKEGGWGPVTRTWEMESIDTCAGSLASVGWARSEADIAEHDASAEALANSEQLRRPKKHPRNEGAPPERP